MFFYKNIGLVSYFKIVTEHAHTRVALKRLPICQLGSYIYLLHIINLSPLKWGQNWPLSYILLFDKFCFTEKNVINRKFPFSSHE